MVDQCLYTQLGKQKSHKIDYGTKMDTGIPKIRVSCNLPVLSVHTWRSQSSILS